MKNDVEDLTSGSLFKKIFIFSVPLIFSYMLQVLFNMADIAVVGKFSGSAALGSVGSTSTLVILFTDFLMGLGSGVNVITARAIGANNRSDSEKSVNTSFILCLIIGLLIMISGLVLAVPMLNLIHTKDELIDGAALYIRIYFLGMPALAVYNFGNAVFSASGETKKPLLYLVIAGVINIILNLIFVIIFKMSVAGVALASIISQYVSAILIIVSLAKNDGYIHLSLKSLVFDKTKAGQILSIGIPSGFQNAIFQIANLFIQDSVNSFSHIVVEGNSAAANADGIIYNVMAAFYLACSSFMSQNYGAGKMKRVVKSYFISIFYSFSSALILGLLLVLFGRNFLSIFTNETAVVDAGMERIVVMGYAYCISAFMDCTISASRGMGKSLIPTILVILGSCVFRIIWVKTVFAHYHTIFSLYMLYPCSWVITGVAEIIYLLFVLHNSIRETKESIIA